VKEIPGYEEYSASPDGGIWRSGKRLNPYLNVWGYQLVTLCRNGVKKRASVHRLVMLAFRGPSEKQVDHVNYNRADNRLENLRYATPSENNLRAFRDGRRPKESRRGFSEKLARAASVQEKHKMGVSGKENACIHGISQQTVCDILKGRTFPELTRKLENK